MLISSETQLLTCYIIHTQPMPLCFTHLVMQSQWLPLVMVLCNLGCGLQSDAMLLHAGSREDVKE